MTLAAQEGVDLRGGLLGRWDPGDDGLREQRRQDLGRRTVGRCRVGECAQRRATCCSRETGSELVTSSVSDGTVTALDIDTGQQRLIGSVRPYGEPVVEHDLSPDGSSVAIRYGPTNLSQKLSVRDVATGNELFAFDDNVGKTSTGARVASTWRWSATDPSRSTTARDIIVTLPGGCGSVRTLTASSPRTVSSTPSRSGTGDGEELIATLPVARRPGGLRPQRRADRHGRSGDLGCGEREAQPSAARISLRRTAPSHSARTAPTLPWAAGTR